jgi:hypothetical protein
MTKISVNVLKPKPKRTQFELERSCADGEEKSSFCQGLGAVRAANGTTGQRTDTTGGYE